MRLNRKQLKSLREFSNQQDPQGPSLGYKMADAGGDSDLLSGLGIIQRSLGQLF